MRARQPHWSPSTAPTARFRRTCIADANGDLFGTTDSRRREQRRHGVRDRQDRRRVTRARRPRWSASTAPTADPRRRPDCGRQRRPVRRDRKRRRQQRGTVFEIVKTAGGLREHAHHAWSALTATTAKPPARSLIADLQRRPVRHDATNGGAGRRRHGVRDPQDRRPATPARPSHWSASTDRRLHAGGLIADANGDLFGTTSGSAATQH